MPGIEVGHPMWEKKACLRVPQVGHGRLLTLSCALVVTILPAHNLFGLS